MNREAVEAYAEDVDDSRERAADEEAVEAGADQTEETKELRGEDPVEPPDAWADEDEQVEQAAESSDPESGSESDRVSDPVTDEQLAELSDPAADGPLDTAIPEQPDTATEEQPTVPGAPSAAATEPLMAPAQAEEFLDRWSEVQIAFVEDPRQSVTDAEALLSEVAAAYQRAVEERRSRLSAVH